MPRPSASSGAGVAAVDQEDRHRSSTGGQSRFESCGLNRTHQQRHLQTLAIRDGCLARIASFRRQVERQQVFMRDAEPAFRTAATAHSHPTLPSLQASSLRPEPTHSRPWRKRRCDSGPSLALAVRHRPRRPIRPCPFLRSHLRRPSASTLRRSGPETPSDTSARAIAAKSPSHRPNLGRGPTRSSSSDSTNFERTSAEVIDPILPDPQPTLHRRQPIFGARVLREPSALSCSPARTSSSYRC